MIEKEIIDKLAVKWTNEYIEARNNNPEGEDFAFEAAENMMSTSELMWDIHSMYFGRIEKKLETGEWDDEAFANVLEKNGLTKEARTVREKDYCDKEYLRKQQEFHAYLRRLDEEDAMRGW